MFVNEQGISLSYFLSEGAKKLTVVFLHGLGSSKECFHKALLNESLLSYHLLFVDLVGHGRSSSPKDFSYSLQAQADCLAQLITSLPLPEDIVIVAHSMGGPIAIYLAKLLVPRVVGIVYAEGNLDFGDCFFSNKIITDFSLKSWVQQGFKEVLEGFQENPQFKDIAKAFRQAGAYVIYKSSEALVWSSSFDQLIYKLLELSIPVLAIFGENNRGKFSSEKKLAEHFPVLFIPDAGHNMMLENPAKFYEAVVDFLSQF